MTQELEKANNNLRIIQQENDSLKRSKSELEFRITQEFQTKISTYESRVRSLEVENGDFKRKVQESDG